MVLCKRIREMSEVLCVNCCVLSFHVLYFSVREPEVYLACNISHHNSDRIRFILSRTSGDWQNKIKFVD